MILHNIALILNYIAFYSISGADFYIRSFVILHNKYKMNLCRTTNFNLYIDKSKQLLYTVYITV